MRSSDAGAPPSADGQRSARCAGRPGDRTACVSGPIPNAADRHHKGRQRGDRTRRDRRRAPRNLRRPLEWRIGRVGQQRAARRQRHAFFRNLLKAVGRIGIVVAGVDLARDLGIADRGRWRLARILVGKRPAAPQSDRRAHQHATPQEGRAQDAEDQWQVGAVHAQRRGHGDQGQRRANRLDQHQGAAARMAEHHFAEAPRQRQADQPARTGMGRGVADIAHAHASHAHHQKCQQQQGQAQAEEAEMMGAHQPHPPGDHGDGHEEDREAEGLHQQIGDIGAGPSDQVFRGAGGGMIERRVARAEGEERQQQENTCDRNAAADQLHQAAAQKVAPAFGKDRVLAGCVGGRADHRHGLNAAS